MLQHIVQNTCTEGIPRSGSLNRVRIEEGRRFYLQIAIISHASFFAKGGEHQADIPILLFEPPGTLFYCAAAGYKQYFIIGNFQYITLSQTIQNLFFGFVQALPQRRPQIRVKGDKYAVFLRDFQPFLCRRPHPFMCHGKGSEMEDFRILYHFRLYF